MNSVYLYPYLGLFEGTNVSVGRGTGAPFQQIGRPGFKGMHFFTPRSIPGVSDNPKHKGERCGGILDQDVIDSSLFRKKVLNLDYLILFYQANDESKDGKYFKSFIHKLAGNQEFKTKIEGGMTAEEIRASWTPDLARYREMRKKYLLYP